MVVSDGVNTVYTPLAVMVSEEVEEAEPIVESPELEVVDVSVSSVQSSEPSRGVQGSRSILADVNCDSCSTCDSCVDTPGNVCILNKSISSSTTCISVGQSNAVIDCNGFTINYSTGGVLAHGIFATNPVTNVTVRNCIITQINSNSGSYGVDFDDSEAGLIVNNTITSSDSDSGAVIIQSGAGTNRVINNTLRGNNGGEGLTISASDDVNVTGNNISSESSYGIFVSSSSGAYLANNTGSSSSETGVRLLSSTGGSFIDNNATSTSQIALQVDGGSANVLTNNILRGASDRGLLVSGSTTGNTFTNNTLIGVTGAQILASTNNIFRSTVINATSTWLSTDGTSSGNNVSNTTFLNANGSIKVVNLSTIPVSTVVNTSNLNVSLNNSFLNSTNLSFLNKSAEITLQGLSFTDPRTVVDFNDAGVFETCNSPQCVEDSYNGSTFVFNVSSFTRYAAQESPVCPGTITVNTTLIDDVSSTGNCVTFGASNIVLDCAGYTISYDSGGTGGDAIIATSRNNVTVKNCDIRDTNAGGASGYGISLTTVTNSTIFNNTIQTNGTSVNIGIRLDISANNNTITNNAIRTQGTANVNYGIYLFTTVSGNIITGNSIQTNGTNSNVGIGLSSSVNNNTITNNTIQTNGTSSDNYGILLLSTVSGNAITGNTIQTNGTSANFGIYIQDSANNNTITNNTIRAQGTTVANYGIHVISTVSGNIITGNTIQTNGTSNNFGINIENSANNNTFANNTIQTQGTLINNYGIRLRSTVSGNIITGNTIQTNGTSDNLGIRLELSANNNNFTNNTISTIGTGSYGISIVTSNSSFNNTILNNAVQWISTDADTSNNFSNTTFVSLNGTIVISNFTLVNVTDITQLKLNVTFNNSFLNSTNLSMLNSSAQITLDGLPFSDPRPLVDFEDDGTFALCSASQCVEDSYNGSTFVFNVSSFTSYAAQESPVCPLNITTNTTLTENVTCSGTTINILTSNVVLDCNGFSVNYSGVDEGFGVNISSFNNVTVKNCIIYQGNTSVSNSDAISVVSSNNVSVMNSTLNATGPSSNAMAVSAAIDFSIANSSLESNQSVALELGSAVGAVARNVSMLGSTAVQDIFGQRTFLDNISASCLGGSAIQLGTVSNFSMRNSYVLCNVGNPGINFQVGFDSVIDNVTITATSGTGVNIANSRNITVENSSISDYLAQTSTLLFIRNVTANESGTFSNAGNGTIDNSTFFNGSFIGLSFINASNVTTSNSSMTGSFRGLRLTTESHNITVVDSVVSGGSNIAIDVIDGASNSTFERVQANVSSGSPAVVIAGQRINFIQSNASNAGAGLGLRVNASNVLIQDSNVVGGSGGAILLNQSHNGSVINTSARTTSGAALQLINSSESNITNSTLISNTGSALVLQASVQNNIFLSTVLFTNSTWLSTDGTSSGNNITNTVFNSTNGNILIIPLVTVPVSSTVNVAKLNTSFNSSFLNRGVGQK